MGVQFQQLQLLLPLRLVDVDGAILSRQSQREIRESNAGYPTRGTVRSMAL